MKALDVAAYVINVCIDNGNPINSLQLNNMLYLIDLYNLKYNGEFLITDCNFEAWKAGVKIGCVYKKYRVYVADPIIREQDVPENIRKELSKDTKLNTLIKNLSYRDVWQLHEVNTKEGSAWHKTWNDGKGEWMDIDRKIMEQDIKKDREH